MKSGVFCNWAELKSWCNGNTLTCEVESTTACPANPTGGTYAFSCNTNTCVLTCNTGYTNCSGACQLNVSVPSNCTSYDQCTAVCSACAQGYELSGGVCIGATLKLSSDSVGVSNYIFQTATPVLTIPSTGNVGIGTTTPIAKLEIIPASGYSILAGNFKIGNVALPTVNSDAATKGYVDSVVSAATSSIGTLWGGTTTGNIWSLNSGNAGVGTDNPTSKLTVGSLAVSEPTDILVQTGDTPAFASLTLASGSFVSTLKSYGEDDLFSINVGNTDSLNIRSSGNVGIGTNIPGAKLHIAGNNVTDSVGSDIVLSRYWVSNTDTRASAIFHYRNSTPGTDMLAFGVSGAVNSSNVSILAPNQISMAKMVIQANGNVGIGTTSPTAKLEVVPSTGYSILAGNYKIGNVALPTVDSDAATKGYVDSTIASATSSITLWGGTTAGSIWNLNSGNVGIGTNNPVSRLHSYNFSADGTAPGRTSIIDVLTLETTNTASAPYRGFGQGIEFRGRTYSNGTIRSLGRIATVLTDDSATNTGSSIIFQNVADSSTVTAPVERMRIQYDGNVGIGTTAPGVKLDVSGNIKTYDSYGAYIGYRSFGSNFRYDNDAIFRTVGTHASYGYSGMVASWGALTFYTLSGIATVADATITPTVRMTINGTGNVGIGTTTPLAKLEVVPSTGYSILAGNYKIGNVALPTANADAATKGYVDSVLGTSTAVGFLPLSGGTMTGSIDMGNNNITNLNNLTVNKITATTIDPLYNIKGINYSTFAPSIAGGVKEEYTGKIGIYKPIATHEYEAVIDFSAVKEGSDLWLWRQVIDYDKSSVDVAIAPYGRFAQVYYLVDGNKLIFRSDKAVEVSYRLTAKRFDWRDWPTLSNDQTTSGLKVDY
jgi:hypothetical protein